MKQSNAHCAFDSNYAASIDMDSHSLDLIHLTTAQIEQEQGEHFLTRQRNLLVRTGARYNKAKFSRGKAGETARALTLLVLYLRLDVVNGVRRLNLQRDGLAGQRLDEDLHAAAEAQHQVQGRLLLDVVVRQGAPILQLLAGEDQALLVGRDACAE